MLRDLIDNIRDNTQGHDLSEAVNYDALKVNFASGDIKPSRFDGTFEAWLFRLGRWGKINFEYFAPGNKRAQKIQRNEFIKMMTDQNLIKAFGQFDLEVLDVNKLALFREYVGLSGKKETEKFIITVDLKPEFKDAVK